MIKHFYSLLVVAFFVAMMTLLTRDHILPWIERGDAIPISMAQVVDSWTAIDDVVSVRLNGQLVGYMRTIANQRDEGGGFEAFTIFTLAREGQARLETATLTNSALEMQQARVAVQTTPGRDAIKVATIVDGNTLRVRLESDTGVRYHEMMMREPMTINLAIEPFVASNELAPGERYAMNVYDPLMGTEAGRVVIEMTGTDTIVLEDRGRVNTFIVESRFQGQTMRMHFDEDRVVVRREIVFGGEGSGPAGANIPEFRLRMDRLPERSEIRQREDLRRVPDLPDFTVADFRGEDSGDPLGAAMGLLPILMREGGMGLLGGLGGGGSED